MLGRPFLWLFLPSVVTSASQLSGTYSISTLKGLWQSRNLFASSEAHTWALQSGSLSYQLYVEVDRALSWSLAVSAVDTTSVHTCNLIPGTTSTLSKVAVSPTPIPFY